MDAGSEAGKAKPETTSGQAAAAESKTAPQSAGLPNAPQFTREEDLHAYR